MQSNLTSTRGVARRFHLCQRSSCAGSPVCSVSAYLSASLVSAVDKKPLLRHPERKGSSGDLGTESKPVCELQTAEKSPQGFMTKSRTGFA